MGTTTDEVHKDFRVGDEVYYNGDKSHVYSVVWLAESETRRMGIPVYVVRNADGNERTVAAASR